jgi:hypothetical protein
VERGDIKAQGRAEIVFLADIPRGHSPDISWGTRHKTIMDN